MPELTLPKSRLLVIDDDPAVIATLQLLFGKKYETFSATTVTEGLRLFEEVHPKIVLLDLRLPDRSGIEALREIRKVGPATAVIILTGYSTRLAAEESLRLGAVDYLNKPFNSDELTRKIERLSLTQSARENDQELENSVKNCVDSFCDFQDLQNASGAFLHDISSPLSCLNVGLDLLKDKIEDENGLEKADLAPVISIMSDSINYLRALVEQWRSFSEVHKLMHGKFEVRRAIDLAVNQVVREIHAADIFLQIHSSCEKIYVPGNHFALARVLVNLFQNAIHATRGPNGRIFVSTVTANDTFHLIVSDNGTGITPAKLEMIFTPHYTTKSSGNGLGLFIARKLIEAMGGTITAHAPGRLSGADFIMTLPLIREKS